MKICIIYHSETGNTRHVAQHIASAFDAHLIEVSDTASYSRLIRFLVCLIRRCTPQSGITLRSESPNWVLCC